MRPLEDGSGANGEVQLAFIATIEAVLAGCDAILAAASGASDAVGPEPSFKVNPRCFRVWDHCKELESAYCALAHESIVVDSLKGINYYFTVLLLILMSLTI